jgi:hypothetical protein
VYLAGSAIEGDLLQRVDAGKALVHAGH